MKTGSRKLLVLAYATFVTTGLPGGVLGVTWIYIQSQFELPLSALGVVMAAQTVGRLITSFASGSLIGRFGIGLFVLAGLGLTALGMLGFALSLTWGLLIFMSFIIGAGSATLSTGMNTFVAANYPSSRMNWLHASFGLGATLGPMIVTFLVIDHGFAWQWSYVALAATRIVLMIFFVVTLREWRIDSDPEQPDEVRAVPLKATLRQPMIWLLVSIFIVATGNELTTGQLTNSLLVEGRAIDPKTASVWISVFYGSLTASRFLTGFIVDHVGHARFLRINMIGTMLGAGLLWSNLSPALSFIGLMVIGFTLAPFAPVMVSDTPGRVGKAHAANAIGFQFTGAGIGMAFSPWLAGTLAEQFGLEIIPPFLLVGAVLVLLLHEFITRREIRLLAISPLNSN